MVRTTVGVADVSTLGKIDIQGADAARFLDFVYTNTFSTLPVGRVRYGLMLREDGMVMDDGTSARLGENHFLMTTTTAAAGQVMRHLDFVQQAFCADWDVRTISVTESWAQFAVAGPLAQDAAGLAPRCARSTCPSWAARPRGSAGVDGAAVPHLVLGRGGLRNRRPDPLRRGAVPRPAGAGRDARRRPLRDGGAERAAHREGLHHPCRDPRPRHRLRHRAGEDGQRRRRTASARPRRSAPASSGRSASNWSA